MKTRYQQFYEMLTPLLITGKITTGESVNMLAMFQLAENDAYERGKENAEHERFAKEHAQNNDYSNHGEGEE